MENLKELSSEELTNTEGGLMGWDDFLVGVGVAVVVGVINDWDGFKDGLASGFN